MDYVLIAITIIPIIFLCGNLFKKEGRLRMLENPLVLIYFIIAFGFFYIFWFEPEILNEYVHMNFGAQVVIYGILAFAPFFHADLAN